MTYSFIKAGVNSDQLTQEITVFLAQTNLEHNTEIVLLSVETVGEELSIVLSEELPQAAVSQLDDLVLNHVPEDSVATFPEYQGNDDALGGGLLRGALYRTGEFVKIVF